MKTRVTVGTRDGEGGHKPIEQVLPLLFEGKAVAQVCEAKKQTNKPEVLVTSTSVCLLSCFIFRTANGFSSQYMVLLTASHNTDTLQVSTPLLGDDKLSLRVTIIVSLLIVSFTQTSSPTIISPFMLEPEMMTTLAAP